MIDYLKEYWMFVMALAAGAGAWYKGKSDISSHELRLAHLEQQQKKINLNADQIKELQINNAVANEHRATLNKLLEKMDSRMEAMDAKTTKKLDRIERVVNHLDSTLNPANMRDNDIG